MRKFVPASLILWLTATTALWGADLPRAQVTVVRPDSGAVLLTIDAELAITAETRTRGLMERSTLPASQGMLFLFERPQVLSFWMFNTLIPLDMIFADEQRRIVTIHAAVPPCMAPRRCPSYASDRSAQFVLEVNGGMAAQAGLSIGDELRWTPP